jgi:hypothetical protein
MSKTIPSAGANPVTANRWRLHERHLNRLVKGAFKVRTPRGRRRKKHLTITASAEYKALVIAVANDLKNRSK